jgi:hypothetical protein
MSNKKHQGDVTSYKEEYLDCRENHNWQWTTDWKLVTGRAGKLLEFTRIKVCQRCKTEAHRRYDGQTGRVIPNSTRYIYPDGYLTSSKDNVDAGNARLEMLRRSGLLTTTTRGTTRSGKQDSNG